VLAPDQRRRNRSDIGGSNDEVLDAGEVFAQSVSSPRIKFGENVVKYDYRVTRDGASSDHVYLG
jgi:hypothetical protein